MDLTKPEPKKDYLKVDTKIPGQSYYCISFVEPINDILVDKEFFFFQKFIDMAEKDKKSLEEIYRNDKTGRLDVLKMKESYKDWRITKFKEWNEEFNKNNKNRLSMRGLKVRGTYETLDEAKMRAEEVRLEDPTFHVFVAPVGYWVPFNPINLDEMESVYQEEYLNEIVKENLEQKKKINKAFEERKLGYIQKSKKKHTLEELKKKLNMKEEIVDDNNNQVQDELFEKNNPETTVI